MALFLKCLVLLVIFFWLYFPVYSMDEPLDQLKGQLDYTALMSVILLVVGKLAFNLKWRYIAILFLLSLVLPFGSDELNRTYKDYEYFHQTFTTRTFKQHFFKEFYVLGFYDKDVTFNKLNYSNHKVELDYEIKDEYFRDEPKMTLDEIVNEQIVSLVESFTQYSELHSLSVTARYHDKIYTLKRFPLKNKNGKPYEDFVYKDIKNKLILSWK